MPHDAISFADRMEAKVGDLLRRIEASELYRRVFDPNAAPEFVLTDAGYDRELTRHRYFRGTVYAADGAISAAELSVGGQHLAAGDEVHWHLYSVDANAAITACLRVARHGHAVHPSALHCFGCVGRMSEAGRGGFATALRDGFARANVEGLLVGEVGGWAVSEEARRSTTILLPIACWSVFGIVGHSLVFSTATHRHRSADILRKLGGFPLPGRSGALPSFEDAHCGCEMEFVAYDSRQPAPAYAKLVLFIREWLASRYPWPRWLDMPDARRIQSGAVPDTDRNIPSGLL